MLAAELKQRADESGLSATPMTAPPPPHGGRGGFGGGGPGFSFTGWSSVNKLLINEASGGCAEGREHNTPREGVFYPCQGLPAFCRLESHPDLHPLPPSLRGLGYPSWRRTQNSTATSSPTPARARWRGPALSLPHPRLPASRCLKFRGFVLLFRLIIRPLSRTSIPPTILSLLQALTAAGARVAAKLHWQAERSGACTCGLLGQPPLGADPPPPVTMAAPPAKAAAGGRKKKDAAPSSPAAAAAAAGVGGGRGGFNSDDDEDEDLTGSALPSQQQQQHSSQQQQQAAAARGGGAGPGPSSVSWGRAGGAGPGWGGSQRSEVRGPRSEVIDLDSGGDDDDDLGGAGARHAWDAGGSGGGRGGGGATTKPPGPASGSMAATAMPPPPPRRKPLPASAPASGGSAGGAASLPRARSAPAPSAAAATAEAPGGPAAALARIRDAAARSWRLEPVTRGDRIDLS